MLVEQQTDAIAFITDPATHGVSTGAIETFETHISLVVLAGTRAFKLKRAVRLPYVDFSTVERRLAACKREITLNRRTAPGIYRAVRKITREADGRLVFGGAGPLVDAVVEMVRFDQEELFDRMATRGALTPPLMTELARVIARFHAEAAVDHRQGGADNIDEVLGINERGFATTHLFSRELIAPFNLSFRQGLSRHARLLDAREMSGKVRRCHGDLHLRNICLFKGVPTLFDCLEFDDAMATIDVLYDLAFLLMDLWHQNLRNEANLVLNRYLDERDESGGLPLVPFFMAIRAAVRAHVTATKMEEQADTEQTASLRRETQAYFDLAAALLKLVTPRVVAIGGLSGSGKSTVAAGIAPAIGPPPGARVLTSDRIRKRLSGVEPETRLPEAAYRSEMSERVYGTIMRDARDVLTLGHSVVADAVFDRPEDRARMAEAAKQAGVPFTGIWLDAPAATLIARVEGRQHDPSDATPDVLRAQLKRLTEKVEWTRINAGEDASSTQEAALEVIGRA